MQTAPRMTRAHFEYLATELGPLVPYPTALHDVADILEATNPRFDREKFIRRGTKAWEEKHPIGEIDDEIPYQF